MGRFSFRVNAVVTLLFLACCFQARAAKLPTVVLHGDRYVSLQTWARLKGFQVHWQKGSKDVEVKSKWAKLSFRVNSRKAEIDGLSVWLCSGVLQGGSTLYISERDVLKTIHPILFPEKLSPGKKVRTIVIAAGHGGKDPGYTVNKRQEKTYTLLLAKGLKAALQDAGFKVVMTRESDVFVELEDQAKQAIRARADLFINVHYNAAANSDASGIETFCLTPEGAVSTNGGSVSPRSPGNRQDSFNALLAFQVQKSLLRNLDFRDRGIRRARFQVLREISMPGILIEGGFLSNSSDAKKILSSSQRQVAVRAIVDGILSYKRLVERH